MKKLSRVLVVVALLLGAQGMAQSSSLDGVHLFESATFVSNQIIGVKDGLYHPITSPITLTVSTERNRFGNVTTFDAGVFTSGNMGEFGNECRVTATGRYVVQEASIAFYLETISFWKDCAGTPTRVVHQDLGTYRYTVDPTGTITLAAME